MDLGGSSIRRPSVIALSTERRPGFPTMVQLSSGVGLQSQSVRVDRYTHAEKTLLFQYVPLMPAVFARTCTAVIVSVFAVIAPAALGLE